MIDWSAPVCTKHETPRIGKVLEDCPIHGKRRVGIFPPSISTPTQEPYWAIFRYYEDGHTRGDGQPSENDLVNYSPDDGAVRLDLTGRKISCVAQAA